MDRRDLDTWNDFDDPPVATGLACAECGRSDVPTWDEDGLGYPTCNDCHFDGTLEMTPRERIAYLSF